jgi:signal transduction histidine kinase
MDAGEPPHAYSPARHPSRLREATMNIATLRTSLEEPERQPGWPDTKPYESRGRGPRAVTELQGAWMMTLNAVLASITHEVSQPLAGIITNIVTCLRLLEANPANLDQVREAARRILRDGSRASEVIARLRALFCKKELKLDPLDLNEATREVISLALVDLQRNHVVLRTDLAADLPPVTADRIQLQQVILNLLRNGSDAMSHVENRPRELLIRTGRDESNQVRLTVTDSGVGFGPETATKLFEPFYTTKSDGMGIGLSLSRSIIEAHHGRLWGTVNEGPGATFCFCIPCESNHLTASAKPVCGA